MASKFTSASPMKKARNFGSAKSGVGHWWLQRLTSASNIVLIVWLAASLLLLPTFERTVVLGWLASPWVAIPLLLLILSVFWHARLGVQVMLEDYIHDEGWKLLSFVLLNFFLIGTAAVAAFSVLLVAFGGVRA